MSNKATPYGFDHEMLIHLIRHAESSSNAHGNIIGGVEATLSPMGLTQIDALNGHLYRFPLRFDAVYCSTMPRARQTLEGLRLGLRITHPSSERYDDRLREINRGDWDGCLRDEVYTTEEQQRMTLLDFDHSAPNGESMSNVRQRMRHWLYDATLEGKRRRWTSIVAVTHGIAIKSLLQGLLRLDETCAWQIAIENTSVTTIKCHGNNVWSLLRLNAVPHLPTRW